MKFRMQIFDSFICLPLGPIYPTDQKILPVLMSLCDDEVTSVEHTG